MKRALSINIKEKSDGTNIYTVKWQEGQMLEERQCKSKEFPRPELIEVLGNFKEFVSVITMIPQEVIHFVVITGATFDYDDKTGNESLSLGVYIALNTTRVLEMKMPPVMVELGPYTLENAKTWLEKYSALAKVLHDEILLYAEGKRAQTELDFEGDNEDGQNEEPEGEDN